MKTLNRIWNSIKNLNLTNYKVINGTMESKKFRLILDFDGILKQGKTMTINELAIEMREGFKQVNNRLDRIETRLDEHDVILKEHSTILKEYGEIFKRNNLK